MIKCTETKVYNFMGALLGMRNSYDSHDKSDSQEFSYLGIGYDEDVYNNSNIEIFKLGDADKKLALKLIKAGSDHAKFMRQILVSVNIEAGNEWYKEFDTYKIGTVANSTSAMHKLGHRLLEASDLSFDDPSSPVAIQSLETINKAIQAWWNSGKKQGSPEWRDMQKAIPMGFIYKRAVTLNYQVLRNIYFSRKHHRLSEWHEFCDWIKSLPYSELITHK